MRVRGLWTVLTLLLIPATSFGQGSFSHESGTVESGSTIELATLMTNDFEVSGFAYGLCFDPAIVAFLSAQDGPDLPQTPDFSLYNMYPGGYTAGVVSDFLGAAPIPVGSNQAVVTAVFESVSEGSADLCYCDTLGTPPTETSMIDTFGGVFLPPTNCGTITVNAPTGPQPSEVTFSVPVVLAIVGDDATVPVTLSNTSSFDVEGFVMALTNDANLAPISVTPGPGLVGAELFVPELEPGGNGFSLGVVLDTQFPMAPGQTIVAEAVYETLAPGNGSLTWTDTLGSPPIENVVVVGAESYPVTFDDGRVAVTFPDCNQNGVNDATDIATGVSTDCDGNGVPDDCQVQFFQYTFNDLDGVPYPDGEDSTIGAAEIENTSSDLWFAQLDVNGTWTLNIPLWPNDTTKVFHVDLDNTPGEEVTNVFYQLRVTEDPLNVPPVLGLVNFAPVTPAQQANGGSIGLEAAGDGELTHAFTPTPEFWTNFGGLRGQVAGPRVTLPNPECLPNECVPTGIANAMTSLVNRNLIDLPLTQPEIKDALAGPNTVTPTPGDFDGHMVFTTGTPGETATDVICTPNEATVGTQNFINAAGLNGQVTLLTAGVYDSTYIPLTTINIDEAFADVDLAEIHNWMRSGYEVSLHLGKYRETGTDTGIYNDTGGHFVNVRVTKKDENGNFVIGLSHDSNQAGPGGNSGTDTYKFKQTTFTNNGVEVTATEMVGYPGDLVVVIGAIALCPPSYIVGDPDSDGKLSLGDMFFMQTLIDDIGSTVCNQAGDIDADGDFDGQDLDLWKQRFLTAEAECLTIEALHECDDPSNCTETFPVDPSKLIYFLAEQWEVEGFKGTICADTEIDEPLRGASFELMRELLDGGVPVDPIAPWGYDPPSEFDSMNGGAGVEYFETFEPGDGITRIAILLSTNPSETFLAGPGTPIVDVTMFDVQPGWEVQVDFTDNPLFPPSIVIDDLAVQVPTQDLTFVVPPQLGTPFSRGDANGDGMLDIGDGIAVLNYIFSEGPLGCDDAADANDDGLLNIADAIYLFNYQFADGPPPPPPFPGCGVDPTDDGLDCDADDCP